MGDGASLRVMRIYAPGLDRGNRARAQSHRLHGTPGDRKAAERERARLELSCSHRDAPNQQEAAPVKAQGGTVEHADPAGACDPKAPRAKPKTLKVGAQKVADREHSPRPFGE